MLCTYGEAILALSTASMSTSTTSLPVLHVYLDYKSALQVPRLQVCPPSASNRTVVGFWVQARAARPHRRPRRLHGRRSDLFRNSRCTPPRLHGSTGPVRLQGDGKAARLCSALLCPSVCHPSSLLSEVHPSVIHRQLHMLPTSLHPVHPSHHPSPRLLPDCTLFHNLPPTLSYPPPSSTTCRSSSTCRSGCMLSPTVRPVSPVARL